MAHRLSVYLDTSVINHYYADDAPERRDITIDLFNNYLKTTIYDAYISDFVVTEIEKTTNESRKKSLLDLVYNNYITMMPLTNLDEIKYLADKYIELKALPPNSLFDALHIACAVVNNIDYLISWNFKHLANVDRERKVLSINSNNNYMHPLRIITPENLLYGI